MGLKVGITLIIIALILGFIAFFVDLCMFVQCTGWNMINPFCYIGWANCQGLQSVAKIVILIGAFVLFLGGIWGIVTSGGKKK